MKTNSRFVVVVGLVCLALSWPAWSAVKIDHDPLTTIKSGERAEVEAKVKEKGKNKEGIKEVRAYFKPKPAERFYFVPMRDSGELKGIFPAMAFGTESFDYFVLVRTAGGNLVRTETYTVLVEDSKKTANYMAKQDPTNIKIDLDKIEQIKDTVEELKDLDLDRIAEEVDKKVARKKGKPEPDKRVEVRTDVAEAPTSIPGVQDWVTLQPVSPANSLASTAGGAAGGSTATATGATAGGTTATATGATAGGTAATAAGAAAGGTAATNATVIATGGAAGVGMAGGVGAVVLGGGVVVAGAGGGGGSNSGPQVTTGGSSAGAQVTVRDNGTSNDDAFTVFVDGAPVFTTPLGGTDSTFISGLGSGSHSIRVQFVAGGGTGTWLISVGGGVVFSGGGTSRSGVIPAIGGSSPTFTFIVP